MDENKIQLPHSLINEIKIVLETARQNVARKVNDELLTAYWNIGRIIVRHERSSRLNDATARSLILELSKTLSTELGKGFSRSNLFNMRSFYINYPDVQTASGQLSWSHYCELLLISDVNKRGFYEKETVNSKWKEAATRRRRLAAINSAPN